MPIRRFPSSEDLTPATASTATQTERVRVTFVDAINLGAGTAGEVYHDARESRPIVLTQVSDTELSRLIPIDVRPLNVTHIDVALANALPTTPSASPHGSRLEFRDSVSHARHITSGFARLARGRGLPVIDGPLDTPASISTSVPADVEPNSDGEDTESRTMLRFASTETVPTQRRYI